MCWKEVLRVAHRAEDEDPEVIIHVNGKMVAVPVKNELFLHCEHIGAVEEGRGIPHGLLAKIVCLPHVSQTKRLAKKICFASQEIAGGMTQAGEMFAFEPVNLQRPASRAVTLPSTAGGKG